VLTSHGVGENLFTVDRDGKLVPQLAASAARTGDLTWTVSLAPGRFFSNGALVTAPISERTRSALAQRKSHGARVGNRSNAAEAAALGRKVHIAEARALPRCYRHGCQHAHSSHACRHTGPPVGIFRW
jgi:hypothetical protein